MDNLNIEQKSDKKAKEFRESGNECFGKKNYMEALIFYNKSIAFSCSKREICLSFGNRSAVYFEIERYDECLDNIRLSRENGYPRDKISKLNDREEKCKKKKAECPATEDFWNYFKLSYPANEKIPWIVNCVEMRWTKKYGRGIYATRDLKAGDIICVEEPIIDYIKGDCRYNHCYNCSKTCMMNLIPCARTASMMFCSTECMNDCYSKTVDMQFALYDDIKLLSEVAAPFGGYKKFDDFMNERDLNTFKNTIFDFDFGNSNDPNYRKNLMTCLLSLYRHEIVFKDENKIFRYVSKKTATHLLEITNLNTGSKGYFNVLTVFVGRGISLLRALINHSCIPNIASFNVNNKTVIFVVKPIKAGEQLLISYFNHVQPNPGYEFEKQRIMELFKFKCDCQICIHNSYKYISSILAQPILFMSRKNTDTAKKLLQEGWYKINNKITKSREELFNVTSFNILILVTLAYYCTYPC